MPLRIGLLDWEHNVNLAINERRSNNWNASRFVFNEVGLSFFQSR